MYFLGYDIGSSSIKVALVSSTTGEVIDVVNSPAQEMEILAPQSDWAEQHPEVWWENVCAGTKKIIQKSGIDPSHIKSIGISYQMHGLVLVDKSLNVLRRSIIWCDSRAISIGNAAFADLGEQYCLENLLNSPGNFTASKLRWVQQNEPEIYEQIYKIMLPGDYIAMKLTGEVNTTIGGLSEAILWDFSKKEPAQRLLEYYGIDHSLIPNVIDTFSSGLKVTASAAMECGLHTSVEVTYRAGDQPNNAMSLRVLNPGEIAATGGTSGVVYGVTDQVKSDAAGRINAFTHVNYSPTKNRIGQLLCINGAGSQYAWIKKQISDNTQTYEGMETLLSSIPIGSDGLRVLPFGNGAERMLNNAQLGAHFSNVQFNIHRREHFYRAALEGIAFSFVYGIKAMANLGIHPETIRVGNDNLFQSATFARTICSLLDCHIEMIKTTGAVGAAKASGIGIGDFNSPEEAIDSSQIVKRYTPDQDNHAYLEAYESWNATLNHILKQST